MKRYSTLLLSFVFGLAACTMAPDYERGPAPVSPEWPEGTAYNSPEKASPGGAVAKELPWRTFFRDQRLQKLIELGVNNNRDFRIAALNVEQAQAQFRIQRSDLLPSISATGRDIHQRFSTNSPANAANQGGTGGTNIVNVNPQTGSFSTLSAGVTSYEFDFFGRVRSLTDQALETYFATEEAQRSAYISLVSQIAIQYLNLRQFEEQLQLAEETLKNVEDTHHLGIRAFEVGIISALDLSSTDVQVQTARVNVARYQQRIAQAQNALTLLIGTPLPADLPPGLSLNDQGILTDIAEGLPSDLLENRPDILAAEHRLLAANANIGAARAAFFPRVTITGQYGIASRDLDSLFNGPAETWNYAPQIVVPIFNFGNLSANLDVSKIRKQIEIATYERTIQTAFREVSDSLAARTMLDQQRTAQKGLVDAQQSRFTLADARYRQGIDSYLNVLTAQQDLYDSQQTLLEFSFQRLANLVTLYKSLGGGWDTPPAPEQQG